MLEVMICVGLLAVAVVSILGTLGRTTEAAHYSELRNQSLDQLRLMAANFGKDVRQAVGTSTTEPDRMVIQTYVNGALTTVTWRVRELADGSEQFERLASGLDPIVHVVDLTTDQVFAYDDPDETRVTRVRLALATQPDDRYPAVSLETDLEMRNVP